MQPNPMFTSGIRGVRLWNISMMFMQCMQGPQSTLLRYVHSVSPSARRHSAIEADHVADMSLVGAIGSGAGGEAFRTLP